MRAASQADEQLLFSIEYSLECGSFPAVVDFEVQQQDLPPALMCTPFLPNYCHYSELPADFDYNLLVDQPVDTFSYPAYASYGISAQQQTLQYVHL